ncbi:hypothetical protein D5266_07945, partial [bacterium c-19]|nr:hypothetical protein [bacterium c-19]
MRKKIGYLFLFFMCITISYTIVGYNTEMQAAGGFNLAKGTKVVLGDGEVVWDVGPQISGDYLLMTSVPFASMTTETSSSSCTRGNGSPGFLSLMLTSCPFANIDNAINAITLSANETSIVTQAPHLPKIEEAITIPLNDRIFNRSTYYWLSGYLTHKNMKFNALNVHAGDSLGSEIYTIYGTSTSISYSQGITYGTSSDGHTNPCYADVRPYASISNKNIVFAAPTDFQDGIWHPYSIDTSQYHNDNEDNPVMLRVTSSLTASLNNILNSKGDQITETVENSTVTLDVNATGNGTISILIYDASGTNISFFKSTSQTNGRILLDLTGIPCGNYQVAVINENFTGSYRPIESSEISNKMSLEIKKPHKLQYAKQPQAGASIGKDYEYSKNVNGNQTIGKITVNPQGVMPLTYTLETNGGDNSYLNFEIDGLNPANESSATNLNVKIKASAPDLSGGGLNAGVYKFCISTQDDNGYPTMPSTSDQTKVCTSLTVEKTNPTIAFNDPSTTKKSIAAAAASWSETATATPSVDTKITYSVSGGDISLVTIDPDSGALAYRGGGAYGKVKIRATVDDDPSTGNDNYHSAFVEKEIVIYREVDGSVTPHANSSDTTIPT